MVQYVLQILIISIKLRQTDRQKLGQENFPNNTSLPADGLAGIFRARSSDKTAIPAPARNTREGE